MTEEKPVTYVYLPEVVRQSFSTSVEMLRRRGHRVVEFAIDNASPEVVERIVEGAQRRGIRMMPLEVDIEEHHQYRQSAGYAERFPHYYSNNLAEKSYEHFIAFQLLELDSKDVFVDLASEHSPVPEIFHRLTGASTYSQDIMYPPGVFGDRIGGDACAMPVADGFASKAALTCSLEHFEEDADTRLFQELTRVLRPGGILCVVPFYLFLEAAVQTDPTVSVPAAVPFDDQATIYCAEGWGNRHGRFYSIESFIERIIRPSRGAFHFTFYRLSNAAAVDPSIYARFAFTATRL
jgi:predicted SAM-dependent methyltransferase